MRVPLRRSWLILAVAVVLGAAAAFGVNRFIQRQVEDIEARGKAQRTVRVLVPKEDLPKGTALVSKVVAVRDIPAEWMHSNAITPEQFDRVENQRLAYPAARGEMILWSLLDGHRTPSFSSRLASGRRAITVPVDEVNSISGMIEPGDRIDLMVSVRRDSRTFMFPLLQNVPVLATGARAAVESDSKDSRRTFTTITLEAGPEEAQRVLAAREIGKVAAVLRPPGDNAIHSAARRDALALLGIGGAAQAPEESSVPVLYGNRPVPKDLLRLSPARDGASVNTHDR
jgi:pilus assembly protein CpaB